MSVTPAAAQIARFESNESREIQATLIGAGDTVWTGSRWAEVLDVVPAGERSRVFLLDGEFDLFVVNENRLHVAYI